MTYCFLQMFQPLTVLITDIWTSSTQASCVKVWSYFVPTAMSQSQMKENSQQDVIRGKSSLGACKISPFIIFSSPH